MIGGLTTLSIYVVYFDVIIRRNENLKTECLRNNLMDIIVLREINFQAIYSHFGMEVKKQPPTKSFESKSNHTHYYKKVQLIINGHI